MDDQQEPLSFSGLLSIALHPSSIQGESSIIDHIHGSMRHAWDSPATPEHEYMSLEEKQTREVLGIRTHEEYLVYRARSSEK